MVIRSTIYFLVCLGLCWPSSNNEASAQIPGMRKYTLLDGFSATNGYEFSQDDRGILWIGTDNGGMSFDGKKFKILLEKGSFPDAEILDIIPLGRDRVVLSPINRDVCYFDNGVLITAKQDPRLKGMNILTHNNNRQDRVTGALWLSDMGLLNSMYSFRRNDIKHYEFGNDHFYVVGVIDNQFIGNQFDPVTHIDQARVYDHNTNRYHNLYDESGRKIETPHALAYSDDNSDYLVSTNSNTQTIDILRYRKGDTVLRRVQRIKSPCPLGAKLYLDPNRNLWLKHVGEENLWFCGSVAEGKPQQEAFHITEPGMLNTVFVDRSGNVWLSSKNNALYFLSKKHFRNALLSRRFPMKKGVPKSISGDGRGRLCISYTNSSTLITIDEKGYRSIDLGHSFLEGGRYILPLLDSRFIINDIHAVVYDMNNHKVSPIAWPTDFPMGTFKDLCLYGSDDLLIATGGKVVYVPSFLTKGSKYEEIFSGRSAAVAVLQDSTILIGTPSGLYKKQGLRSINIAITDSLVARHSITDIQALPGGGALIGTNARGLLRYTTAGKVQEVQQGKLNHVRSIYKQNDSVYWTSTNEGIYAFTFNPDWSVKEVKNYTFYDGLPSNSATSVYVWQDTAYVATSEGLGILPLKDNTLLQMAPPDIYVNTLQTGKSTFRYPDSLPTLSRDENSLLFSLSAISYESLGNIQYYYRLYPFQTEWVRTTDPDIRFAQLPPGRYTFQAYALNAKGIRSLKTIALAVYLQPAFWETSYFKVALVVLAAFLFYLLLRWWLLRREKRKYRKVQDKKRLAELELEAIKAQINPHFIYNCLNSIQYLNYKAEHIQAQQYLDLFARLIRMTMQYSQQAFISLEEEVDYLSLYLQLEKLRFKDKLQYDIRIDSNMNKNTLLPAMLIQPYVENALKHGVAGKPAGTINVSFSEEAGRLIVIIQDNGAGFPDTQKRQGALGLKLSGTRALSYNELFNLDIRIHRYNQQDIDPASTGAVVTINMLGFRNVTPEKSAVG